MPDHATIIDGKTVAAEHTRALLERTAGEPVGLGILVATDNPATAKYIAAKRRQAEEMGYSVTIHKLSADSSQADIIAACEALNADDSVDGYIVQLPLPDGVDVDAALAAVAPEKDADGLSPANLEKLYAGDTAVIPATPKGILSLLEAYKIEVQGKTVTVVGQGRLTGGPLSKLLELRGANVIPCDKSTPDIPEKTRGADVVVVAAGSPGLITADMVKEGAAVIDVGITRIDGEIVGDVDYDAVSKKTSAITPVPGGVGPMTVVSLLENVADLAQSQAPNNR
jgi:methylenetetrahydrofolate dehydrogenase (NADP+)/methenyltetrahydrofolate cyclohydrolase